MTLPGNYPLNLYRGDTYLWRFQCWQDPAGTIPADLTGVVAKAEIRNAPGGVSILPLDCTIIDTQTVEVYLDAAMWAGVSLTKGAWDLQLTYANDHVHTVLAGAVNVTLDVTDSVATVGRRTTRLYA